MIAVVVLIIAVGTTIPAKEPPTTATEPLVTVETTDETTETTTEQETVEEVTEVTEVATTKVKPTTYRVTAYCACSKCCGKYALNRPVDENGNEIVYGASGTTLISGYSCASPLPFGTKIELEGYGTVKVQDRTATWIVDKYGKNVIDIYFDNHEEAYAFGCHYVEGAII